MYLLTINLYEIGQFLRVVLWISLPMVIISMLVTTWVHYRRKGREQGEFFLSVEGYEGGTPASEYEPIRPESERATAGAEPRVDESMEENEKIYRGILWMKAKYEEYRDLADKRYNELREELSRSEKRYQALLVVLEEKKALSLAVREVKRVAEEAAALEGKTAADEVEPVAGKTEPTP